MLPLPIKDFEFYASWRTSNQIKILQVNKKNSCITLKFDGKEIQWEVGESLLRRLELEGIVRQVFPLHGMLGYIYKQITCSSHAL